jgi:hypothetical protein
MHEVKVPCLRSSTFRACDSPSGEPAARAVPHRARECGWMDFAQLSPLAFPDVVMTQQRYHADPGSRPIGIALKYRPT